MYLSPPERKFKEPILLQTVTMTLPEDCIKGYKFLWNTQPLTLTAQRVNRLVEQTTELFIVKATKRL